MEAEESNVSCAFCDQYFINEFNLNIHIKKAHFGAVGVVIPYEEEKFTKLQFNCMNEFLEWKSKIEDETLSLYSQKTFVVKPGNRIYYYYECSRSGQYQPKGKGERRIKSQKSSKIGGRCPARITAIKSDSSVSVKYYEVHKGHEKDIEHLRLPKSFRAAIAGKLREGVPMKRVLDDIRESTIANENFTRISLLNRKDLHNIKKEFNVGKHQHTMDSACEKLSSEEGNFSQGSDTSEFENTSTIGEPSNVENNNSKRPVILNKVFKLIEILKNNSFSKEDEEQIEMKLDNLISFCSMNKIRTVKNKDKNQTSGQKRKIEKQFDSFSTNKKINKKLSLKNAIHKDSTEDSRSLLVEIEEIVISKEFDHTYNILK